MFQKIQPKNITAIDPKMREQIQRVDFLPQDPNRPVLPPLEEDEEIRIISIGNGLEAKMRLDECIGIRRL